jgi:hypothetical protein
LSDSRKFVWSLWRAPSCDGMAPSRELLDTSSESLSFVKSPSSDGSVHVKELLLKSKLSFICVSRPISVGSVSRKLFPDRSSPTISPSPSHTTPYQQSLSFVSSLAGPRHVTDVFLHANGNVIQFVRVCQ